MRGFSKSSLPKMGLSVLFLFITNMHGDCQNMDDGDSLVKTQRRLIKDVDEADKTRRFKRFRKAQTSLCERLQDDTWKCGIRDEIDTTVLNTAPTISMTKTPTKPPTYSISDIISNSSSHEYLQESILAPEPTLEPSMKQATIISSTPTFQKDKGMQSINENAPELSSLQNVHSDTFVDQQNSNVPFQTCEFDWEDNNNCISTMTSKMTNDERRLYSGQFMCSESKDSYFGMTSDYHLVICNGNHTLWSKGPFIDKNPHVVFRVDGSLEVVNRKNSNADDYKIMWSSGTSGVTKSELLLDDMSNLKIINSIGQLEWAIEPLKTFSPSISKVPTYTPTISPAPTGSRSPVGSETYFPGELFVDPNTGLKLSIGLQARLIAKTGLHVPYTNKTNSFIPFHDQPDAGGCFSASDGGWYYMSNSEAGNNKDANGGVGRIKFNVHGDIEEYKMVLSDTRMNCGSGVTPWNTYISCEEYEGEFGNKKKRPGQCWEVHPSELWLPRPTAMGGVEGGRFESAAFDARNMTQLKGFVTTDHKMGALYRFTPDPDILKMAMVSGDYSEVLHHPGTIDYLLLDPIMKTFQWTTSKRAGMLSAKENFPNAEGIDVHDGRLYFTTKTNKELFILDLDNFEYSSSITLGGAFNGQPDQIVRLLPEDNEDQFEESLLYFLEDGGQNPAGVFARDPSAKRYLTVLEGGENNSDETTGLAFCDSGRRMMVAFQDEGELYEIIRSDGKPFYGATVDIKYHDV